MHNTFKTLLSFTLTIIAFFILTPINLFAAEQYKCTNGTVLYSSYSDCVDSGCAADCVPVNKNTNSNAVSLTNPLGENKTSIPELLGTVINSVLGVIGSLALVMFIYGGATWMLSAGNTEQVSKGKNILIWAAVGIIIIFSAYALVKFVLTTVTGTGG